MSKIVVIALTLALLILGFSSALFAYTLPLWLPIVLVVLSVVVVALMAYKVAKKRSKHHSTRHYSAPMGMPQTPRSWEADPPAPRHVRKVADVAYL